MNGTWAPEEDETEPRKNLHFRSPEWMAEKLRSLAMVETDIRKLRKTRGVLSVNKMLAFVIERYFVAYEKINGPLPDPDNTQEVAAYAAAVSKKREAEERAKTTRR